ncbi:MAG: TlpA family protein disulfide reductase [Phycisphaeraceae bacterium]|nr:TlpA family protein disulfide reductase [Phycisphaeraceae bacterium]
MHCRALSIAAISLSLFVSSAPAADVVREATGQLRIEMDRMELTKFPAENWSKLGAWANGAAITPASAEGKVVLIASWASWHPASLRAMPIVQNAAAKYGDQGLLVVGVHHAQGWDEAEATAKARGFTFPIAHDTTGEFRKALKMPHDPMFFFIDRAGHLRYAAVASGSIDEACAELVKETKEQAGDLPRIRREREEAAAKAKGKTSDINMAIDLSTLPPVPPGYLPPQAPAYRNISWPKMDTELGKRWGLIDQQSNKFSEKKIAFSPVNYFPAKPETQGRAIVIYIWHPDVPETYTKVMPQMDLLQQNYQRDLAVIGAAVPLRSVQPNRQSQPGEEEESVAKFGSKYANFIASRRYKHALALDASASSLAGLAGQGGSEAFPLPGAIVVSSDGVIRWVGWSNGPDFKYAIETIVAVDPAVQARRAADRAFIEARNR